MVDVENEQLRADGAEEGAFRDADRVHHAEVAPRATIDADHEEPDHLRREDDGKRAVERVEVFRELVRIFKPQTVRRVVAERDKRAIEQHLGDAPLVHELDDDGRHGPRLRMRIAIVVDADAGQVDREEHHQNDKGKRGRGRHRPGAAREIHRDAQPSADGGERPEQRHGGALGQSDRHEAMRRVIASALRRAAS